MIRTFRKIGWLTLGVAIIGCSHARPVLQSSPVPAPAVSTPGIPVPEWCDPEICAGINNSYECAQAIERHVLAKGGLGVRRDGDQLLVTLTSGREVTYKDSIPDADDPEGFQFLGNTYLGLLADVGQHVIERHWYEGGDYLLLSALTGREVSSPGVPVVSPDAQFVAAVWHSIFLDRESGARIWRVVGGELQEDWSWASTQGMVAEWQPKRARWLSPTVLVIEEYESYPRATGMTELRHTDSGWTLQER